MFDDIEGLDTETLVQRLFALLNVDSFGAAMRMYTSYDHKLRASGDWNPTSEIHIVNHVKELLEEMNPEKLDPEKYPDCLMCRVYMLASWYSRTLKFLLLLCSRLPEDERFDLAKAYADKMHRIDWFPDMDRQISWTRRAKLWQFLVYGDLQEAYVFLGQLSPEHATEGRELLREYERHCDHVPRPRQSAPA